MEEMVDPVDSSFEVVAIASTSLCARKLIEMIESDKPNLAKQYFVDRAVEEAAFVLERIDKKWPTTS